LVEARTARPVRAASAVRLSGLALAQTIIDDPLDPDVEVVLVYEFDHPEPGHPAQQDLGPVLLLHLDEFVVGPPFALSVLHCGPEPSIRFGTGPVDIDHRPLLAAATGVARLLLEADRNVVNLAEGNE
jgi:hypothetical protein